MDGCLGCLNALFKFGQWSAVVFIVSLLCIAPFNPALALALIIISGAALAVIFLFFVLVFSGR